MQRAGLLAVLIAVPVAAKPVPRAIPASDLMIRQSSPEIDWRWRAAPEAATQPGLLAALRRDALNEAGRARTAARADAAGARTAGFPFRKHESITDWTLAADTPHLLALAGQVYSFTAARTATPAMPRESGTRRQSAPSRSMRCSPIGRARDA